MYSSSWVLCISVSFQQPPALKGVSSTAFEFPKGSMSIASFPGLHAQLLSLAVQKLGVEAWERG